MIIRGCNKTTWAKYCCREYQADAIQNGIKILRDRAINWNRPGLTAIDMLRIFVPPDIQRLAVEAFQLLDVSGQTYILYTSETTGLSISIEFNKPEFASLSRETIGRGFINDCPERAKLDEWVTWRLNRGMEWGTVQAVWLGLQKACHREGSNQLKTVRYLWPTVMTLLEAGGCKEDADKLRKARPPEWVPHLPQELRAAMKVTAGVVAGTLLLPDEHRKVPLPVHVLMTSADRCRAVNLGWNEMVRPI